MTVLATDCQYDEEFRITSLLWKNGVNNDYRRKLKSTHCSLVVRRANIVGDWIFRLDQIKENLWVAVLVIAPFRFFLIDTAEAKAIMLLVARGEVFEGINRLAKPDWNHGKPELLEVDSGNIDSLIPELREVVVTQRVARELTGES